MPKKSKQLFTKKNTGIFLLIVVGAIILLVNIVGRKQEKPLTGEKKCPPIASGRQIYDIQTDKPKNPQIVQVEFDEQDVSTGGTQTIIAKIKDTDQASSVKANIQTDNKNTAAVFSLVQGTANIWQGSWTNTDTHCQTYMATITAENESSESSVAISFR